MNHPTLAAPPETAGNGLASLRAGAESFLAGRRAERRLRQLRPLDFARSGPLDLTHNDYLALRGDELFQQRARAAVEKLPVGAGASRLLGGEHPVFRELEQAFARFKEAPDALFFASGYAANEAVAAVMAPFGARIFSDRLNHASIIDGIRLSGLPSTERVIFPHRDLDWLEKALARSDAAYNLIFTESLFSMDGDRTDLVRLARLAESYRGILIIDEAHAVGCMGEGGRGLVPQAGLDQNHLVTVNTCGKALGVQGALVCLPSWLRELMINTARPFIYTTAPSPWLAAALKEAVAYVAQLEDRRLWLAQAAETLRDALVNLGYQTGDTSSHIIPVLCGEDHAALALAQRLETFGVNVRAIRPPTVPEGTSRVRLSLNAGVDAEGLARIIEAFAGARS